MRKKSLRAARAAADSSRAHHVCRWVLLRGSSGRSPGRNRKARRHCRCRRLAHGTCRGRSRLRLPGQRRAAGRSSPRPNSRRLRESKARRPPARAPRFPPQNVSRGEGQSLALEVRPELSRRPVQVSAVSHLAVPWAPAFRNWDYLLWLLPQRLGVRGGHLELPDFSAAVAAAAARTVKAGGSGERASGAAAHVLTGNRGALSPH